MRSLQAERRLRLRTERARRAEREWSRELREQVLGMYRSRGPSADLRELVLQVAVQLTAPNAACCSPSATVTTTACSTWSAIWAFAMTPPTVRSPSASPSA